MAPKGPVAQDIPRHSLRSAIDHLLPPEKHTFDSIWGHAVARRYVPRLLSVGRLPHAILLTGPDAVGKRSLAFAMAKAILSAGIPVKPVDLKAPTASFAKHAPGEPPEGADDDLFSEQEDLFGGDGEEDLFAGLEEESAPAEQDEPAIESPPPPEPAPAAVETAPQAQPEKETRPRRVATEHRALRAEYRGFDDRVCRLVEASYGAAQEARAGGGHIDLNIIEPKGRSRNILVDQIRELQEITARRPLEGDFRVVLVFGADTITQEGGNSILKLLEEPPGYLVMILVANQLHRVIPTIRSRCSIVRLSPLGREDLAQHLVEREGMEGELARVAAALAEGRPGAALALMEKKMLERRDEVFEARLQLDRFGLPAMPASAARLTRGGDLDDTLWLLLSFTRDRMVRKLAPEEEKLLIHGDVSHHLDGGRPDPYALDAEADRITEAFAQLRHPFIPNPRALLQLALWPERAQ